MPIAYTTNADHHRNRACERKDTERNHGNDKAGNANRPSSPSLDQRHRDERAERKGRGDRDASRRRSLVPWASVSQ
jgi:hypothetical protein